MDVCVQGLRVYLKVWVFVYVQEYSFVFVCVCTCMEEDYLRVSRA